MFRLFLFVSLIPLITNINKIDVNDFIPFGTEHNDQIFEDEDLSEEISLSISYPFFNKSYNQIRLSPHGLILFGNETSSFERTKSPVNFPLDDITCIAPYWINTNLEDDSISQISYREILIKSESETLLHITNLVRNAFPQMAKQRMIWAFVVTWYEIPQENSPNSRNTYQTILTTNGRHSFTILTYFQIQWSENSQGTHALIGFNSGDENKFYQIKNSLTSDIMNIVNQSNIGIPGQFVYHTTENLNDIQCEQSNGLEITPFRGSIYGGYEIRLHGICFNNQTNYLIRIDNQTVDDCRVLNSLYIQCTMPMIMDSGKILVQVIDRLTGNVIDSTDFLAHVPEDNGELILKNYLNLTQQIADPHNDQLILEFQSNSITRKYLFRLIIYDYSTQLSSDNQALINRTQQRIDLGLGYLNLSQIENLTIPYEKIFPVTNDPNDRVHALQISFEIQPRRGWIRSALFVGAKIFTVAASLNAAYCPAWLLLQTDPNKYIEQVPTCACQVPTSPWPEEFMGFRADEGCDGRKPIEQTCAYHPKARGCYRKKSDKSWAGAQCCYDEHGKFLEQGQEGAGTLDLVSPDANSWLTKGLSMFGHFFSDFLSYWSCCRTLLKSDKLCRAYYDYRPAGKCEHMDFESIEQHGNSHFVSLHGKSFTFSEEGEFLLLDLPQLHGQQIQIRLKSNEQWTQVESTIGIVAFAIGFNHGQTRVQFELLPLHQHLEIRINSRLIDLPDEEFQATVIIYEDQFVKIKRKTNGAFKISFPGTPLRFRAQIRPTFDFFDLETLLEREKFTQLSIPSFGLLGDLQGLIFPNGTRLSDDQLDNPLVLSEYGQSWKISRNNSIFYYLFDHLDQQQISSNDQREIICNDAEYCIKNTVDENQSDQIHWESLSVTIPPDILPEIQHNNAVTYKYSFFLSVLSVYLFILY